MSVNPEILEDFIENSGLSYKKGAVSWIFDCPKCSKKDRLYIRRKDGRFVCFYCKEIDNFQGRPEFALSLLCSMPLKVVQEQLYGVDAQKLDYNRLEVLLGDFFGDEDEYDLQDSEIPTMAFPLDYWPVDDPRGAKGLAYLESRGIPLELAKEYHLRYSTHLQRVVFPVETEGRVVGWQNRLIRGYKHWNEEKAKYVLEQKILSSTGVPRDRLLMFGDRITGDHAVVCEGPIDAIKAHACGGNVATMGKAISRGQIEALRRKNIKKVYLALDPDAASETKRLVEIFADLECYQMLPPAPYKDIGEMPVDEVRELFLRARRINTGTLFIFLGGRK